jgi:DNA end-binding protein Ku
MLHSKDKSPISFERVCQKDGKPVAWNDLVKGYEYEKGRFVVLTKEDIAAAALEKTRRIDILDFVGGESIDDRYFDKPYYLTPGRGGDASYALLREAIRASQRIGIAKFVLRDVQHLAALEAIGDALVLSTLRFADELVDASTLGFPSAKIRKKELDLAKTLVNSLAAEWTPKKYTDDYRENLMRIIKARMKGKTAHLVSAEPERDSNVVDLMERLRQSLATSKGSAKARRPSASSTRTRKRTTKRHAAA